MSAAVDRRAAILKAWASQIRWRLEWSGKGFTPVLREPSPMEAEAWKKWRADSLAGGFIYPRPT